MRFPYFSFWPERYWLDAYDLSDAEHGIYLQVLIHMWNTPGCRIPNDKAWLAGKFKRSEQDIEKQVFPILLRFCKTNGNSWWQVKLQKEYQHAEKLRARGSAGGKARGQKAKHVSLEPTTDTNLSSAPTPTPTPTPTREERSSIVRANKRGCRLSPDWEPAQAEREFAAQLGLDPDAVTPEFRDYWCAVSGSKAVKTDWPATYRNRCRQISTGRRNGSRKLSPNESNHVGMALALDEHEQRERQRDRGTDHNPLIPLLDARRTA